jgi:cell wall-associated NlpC family hydrolase
VRAVGRSSIAALAALAVAGCGVASRSQPDKRLLPAPNNGGGVALHGHPQAIDPVAGEGAQVSSGSSGPTSVSVSSPGGPLAQPITNSEVMSELAASGISANPDVSTLTPSLLALAPVNAPAVVQEVINAGNSIAKLPYIWGGGHGRYEDTGYDCSGSLSFILASAGLLKGTETSGELMRYGEPGPGKWITIFANQGHTFAYIAGLRFDTVALAETGSRWSNRSADEPDLHTFAVRHPPGL